MYKYDIGLITQQHWVQETNVFTACEFQSTHLQQSHHHDHVKKACQNEWQQQQHCQFPDGQQLVLPFAAAEAGSTLGGSPLIFNKKAKHSKGKLVSSSRHLYWGVVASNGQLVHHGRLYMSLRAP